MKKFNLFFVQTLVVLSLVFVVGCSDDKDDAPPDPAGTMTLSMANSGWSYSQPYSPAGGTSNSELGYLYITTTNNFCFLWSENSAIANVGKVNGLGSITKIPSSGWANTTSVEPGNGYVIKASNNWGGNFMYYARLYVVEWTVNTSGGIIGAKVKYQYPFEP